jgi:hypothetical protein
MIHLSTNVRLLGSVQLEPGHAYCLTGFDGDIDRGLQSLHPWRKEPARNRVIVLHTSIANLIPCPGVLGECLAKAVVFVSGCTR